jgi:hypothetical protein
LSVEHISQDCAIGEEAFQQIDKPAVVQGQRVAGLRFSDIRVQALLMAIVCFLFLPRGFSNRDLREHLAPLLGISLSVMTQGKMSYDLRRLRLHGLIERIPKTHRYRLTPFGQRAALFLPRIYNRALRPGLGQVAPVAPAADSALRAAFDKLDVAVERWCDDAKLAA